MNKTQGMRLLEYESGRSIEELIREQVEAGKDWSEIADTLDVSRLTLRRWVRDLGLRRETCWRLVEGERDA